MWTALALIIAVLLPQDIGLSSAWTVSLPTRVAFGIAIAIAVAGIAWVGALAAASVVFLLTLAQMAVAPTVSFGHFIALATASYAAGRLPVRRHALAGLALSTVTTIAIGLAVDDPQFEFVFPMFVFSTAWVLGRVVRAHSARADLLGELAAQLDRQQEELAQLAALEERQRIAAEMHDVLANSLSSIVVQAGAAAEIAGDHPEVTAALRNIQDVGRSGLVDVRSLLRGLDAHGSDTGASPGVADIEALATRMRNAGLDLSVDLDEDAKAVPASVGLNAYRIVQEALTNALRHAGRVRSNVTIDRDRDALRITVTNAVSAEDAPTPTTTGSGRGLAGMRQRAAMHRGTLSAGETRDGTYVVEAVLRLDTS